MENNYQFLEPVTAQVDFSTNGPFPTQNVILLDQKSPRDLGLIDAPILADLWGWTDPENGEEYVIVTADAEHVPFAIRVEEEAPSVYNPVGGVAFAKLSPSGDILPLGVWRHPTVTHTDHGDVQVFANHAYVTGESPGYGLVIFDLTKLRGRDPCGSPEECNGAGLNELSGFALVRTSLRDTVGGDVEMSAGHNLTIDEASGYMAIHTANTFKDDRQGKFRARSTKILKIDPADPTDPLLLADLNKASHDGWITRYHGPDREHRGKIIMLLANGYKHEFIEANDKEVLNNPKNGPSIYQLTDADGTFHVRKLSQLVTYENDDFGHQLALSEDHRFIFFNDENQFQTPGPARQMVFDISQLKWPKELFQCFYSVESVSHDGYVVGNYLFNGNYTSGLRVVDVSDVEGSMCAAGHLNEVASIDTEPRLNSFADVLTFDVSPDVTLQSYSDYAGVWGNYPYFKSGFIVMADFFNGLFSVKLDLPE
jgi:choice-of-anchor B domain-containing protein